MQTDAWLTPAWAAPATVRVVTTTRAGGVSGGSYASLNLADHVGDEPAAVRGNRARLRETLPLPAEPAWLEQVHGADVLTLHGASPATPADAAWTDRAGVVLAVLTADCLPVVLCDAAGSAIAVAHAGWRGLAGGVLEATVRAMPIVPARLLAWLGPAISQAAFEVGPEVREAFVTHDANAATAFKPGPPGKWYCDLYTLARQRLAAAGVIAVSGGGFCTFQDAERFFSYRRDGQCGRMATVAWLAPGESA